MPCCFHRRIVVVDITTWHKCWTYNSLSWSSRFIPGQENLISQGYSSEASDDCVRHVAPLISFTSKTPRCFHRRIVVVDITTWHKCWTYNSLSWSSRFIPGQENLISQGYSSEASDDCVRHVAPLISFTSKTPRCFHRRIVVVDITTWHKCWTYHSLSWSSRPISAL